MSWFKVNLKKNILFQWDQKIYNLVGNTVNKFKSVGMFLKTQINILEEKRGKGEINKILLLSFYRTYDL